MEKQKIYKHIYISRGNVILCEGIQNLMIRFTRQSHFA